MSMILYYSNLCENSKKILHEITRTDIQNSVHFVCVDNRKTAGSDTTVVLGTGETILIPKQVVRVPAMFIIEDARFLFGNEIHDLIGKSCQKSLEDATAGQLEPFGFATNHYSDIDEVESVAGYYASATHDNMQNIITPPEDYKSDKVDEESIKSYQDQRSRVY